MKNLALDIKSMSALKTAFTKLTNSESWDQAEIKYPVYAVESQLRLFIKCDLKKEIPKTHQDYCLRAKASNEKECDSVQPNNLITINAESTNPVTLCTLKSEYSEISGGCIRNRLPSFLGFDLNLND